MNTKDYIEFGDLEKIEFEEYAEDVPVYAITSSGSCTCSS